MAGSAGVAALAFGTLAAAVPPAQQSAPAPLFAALERVDDATPTAQDRGPDAVDRELARQALPSGTQEAEAQESEAGELTAIFTPDVTGQLWVVDAVNVRTGPSADDERLATAAAGSQVDVTGATEGDWTQVIWESEVAWVHTDYLSKTKPEPEPEPAAASSSTSGSSSSGSGSSSGSSSGGVSGAYCSKSSSIEPNLQRNAAAAYRAVCAKFPAVSSFGGFRPGDSGDHGSGRAVDIMISGAAGWDIARYLQANASTLGVTYVIYEQKIWLAGKPTSSWEFMADRGGATANHYDHVHVSTR